MEWSDRTILLDGQRLNDRHVNYAQMLIRVQFPKLNGLILTLKPFLISNQENAIQIIHCKNDIWVVASTIVRREKVLIYDSLFNVIDEGTRKTVKEYFGSSCIMELACGCPRQVGTLDCGVFSIMIAAVLAHGHDLCKTSSTTDTQTLRSHLVKCFEAGLLCPLDF